MSTTSIQWTERVWNPITGCTKVSQGCKNCYAEGVANRFWATQYPKVTYLGTGLYERIEYERHRRFTDVQTHEDRLLEPLSWRKPAKVFVNSMSDLFHEDVPDSFIDRVFAVMALAPQHTFQILTKRPARMREYFTAERNETIANRIGFYMARGEGDIETAHALIGQTLRGGKQPTRWPLPNVWLGVSCENQQTADERIPLLLQTPAAVRWVSAEPLLGPLHLTLNTTAEKPWYPAHVNWVVVGGESGPGARPFDLAWGRSIVEQCKAFGVPVFVKQLGADPWVKTMRHHGPGVDAHPYNVRYQLKNRKGGDIAEWPTDLQVREWPEVCA